MSADDSGEDAKAPANGSQRIDRWLWFVRVVKSRTLAAGLVTEGRVRLNRDKIAKPSQGVKIGDVLTITVGPRLRIFKVVGLGQRRGPPSEAMGLYEDLTPPPPPREDRVIPASGEREPGSGRPTKRDRRLLDRLKGDD
jgi:ribosome-associated heat shock protein Hsp15